MENLPPGLLEDVKNYLDITWTDDGTDRKLAFYIAAGIQYLDRRAGEALDYMTTGDGRTLLMW